MNDANTLPTLERINNFRELGGLSTEDGRHVRPRALFRSGHWGNASETDRAALEALGVGVVLDFRTPQDIAQEGADQLPPGTEHVLIPTGDPAAADDTRALIVEGNLETLREHFGGDRAVEYMRRGASALVTERTDSYTRFLKRLAAPGCPPALFHCSAGKDRAGWAASSLLLALGVTRDQVVEHYLMSNQTFDANRQNLGLPEADPEVIALVTPLTKVRAEYIEASIAAAEGQWGSLDGYFHEGLGLTAEEREQLRQNWLR
jgi:protein-tyrosine phosphatase